MWWYGAVICGAILAASWIWYLFAEGNYENYLELFQKTRWTLRPFVPIFLVPEMLKAGKNKQWFKLIFYFVINFIFAAINIAILFLVLILTVVMVMSFI